MGRIILFLLISLSTFAQNGAGKHFWGSAILTSGINFSFHKSRPVSIGITFCIGSAKEYFDHRKKNPTYNHLGDIFDNTTGSFLGFAVSNQLHRRSLNPYKKQKP